jgi:hypothetical protein
MRKFRASMEPFWDLEISIYVEYLTLVSVEYIISCMFNTFSDKYGWPNFMRSLGLRNSCINKATIYI